MSSARWFPLLFIQEIFDGDGKLGFLARWITAWMADGTKRTSFWFSKYTVDRWHFGGLDVFCESPMTYADDPHLMTFAPTGSGKGRGIIIPTLLSYPGSVVVIDPKGENYKVTARRRREMGHQVVVLDPFKRATRAKEKIRQIQRLRHVQTSGDDYGCRRQHAGVAAGCGS